MTGVAWRNCSYATNSASIDSPGRWTARAEPRDLTLYLPQPRSNRLMIEPDCFDFVLSKLNSSVSVGEEQRVCRSCEVWGFVLLLPRTLMRTAKPRGVNAVRTVHTERDPPGASPNECYSMLDSNAVQSQVPSQYQMAIPDCSTSSYLCLWCEAGNYR